MLNYSNFFFTFWTYDKMASNHCEATQVSQVQHQHVTTYNAGFARLLRWYLTFVVPPVRLPHQGITICHFISYTHTHAWQHCQNVCRLKIYINANVNNVKQKLESDLMTKLSTSMVTIVTGTSVLRTVWGSVVWGSVWRSHSHGGTTCTLSLQLRGTIVRVFLENWYFVLILVFF